MWLFDLFYFSFNSANLICRGTDISKYFRESLGFRDNENRLLFLFACSEVLVYNSFSSFRLKCKILQTVDPVVPALADLSLQGPNGLPFYVIFVILQELDKGHIMGKHLSGIWGQQRPRSACTSASDQDLHCPFTESLDTVSMESSVALVVG